MKTLTSMILTALMFVAGTALAKQGSVSQGNGTSIPVTQVFSGTAGSMVNSPLVNLEFTVTPSAIATGTWRDTSMFTELTVGYNGNSGCATLTVQSTSTIYGSSVPGSSFAGVVVSTIVATEGFTKITTLGNWTRILCTTNVGGGYLSTATMWVGSTYRY